MIKERGHYSLIHCAIVISCFFAIFLPVSVSSKTIYYSYNNLGYLQQAQTATGPVFGYSFDLAGNRKSMMVSPLDSDNDGLSNSEEISYYGTNPYLADTDGDGLSDGVEVNYWGADWISDFDNDRLVNLLDRDSDGDGYGDGFEINRGNNPSDPDDHPSVFLGPIIFPLLSTQDIH